jgi:hypothetical protein
MPCSRHTTSWRIWWGIHAPSNFEMILGIEMINCTLHILGAASYGQLMQDGDVYGLTFGEPRVGIECGIWVNHPRL